MNLENLDCLDNLDNQDNIDKETFKKSLNILKF